MTHTPTQTDPTPARSGPSAKRVLVVLLLAALIVTGWVVIFSPTGGSGPEQGEPGHIAWRSDFAAATEEAKAADKPALVFFTADWCGPCQVLKADVLWKPDVASAIDQRSVPIKVDLTSPGETENRLAQRFGVRGIPTLILLGPDGDPIHRAVGSITAGQLTGQWLDAGSEPTPSADDRPASS